MITPHYLFRGSRHLTDRERPIIYGYLTANEDLEAVKFWRQTWYDAGWAPTLLEEKEAKQHPSYKLLKEYLPGEVPSNHRSLQWLAMAQVGGGWMGEFDVFPLREFRTAAQDPAIQQRNQLTIWENVVPSLVSGTKQQYERGALSLAKVTSVSSGGNGAQHSDILALMHMKRSGETLFFHSERKVLSGGHKLELPDEHNVGDCREGKIVVHFQGVQGTKFPAEWLKMWIQGICSDLPQSLPTMAASGSDYTTVQTTALQHSVQSVQQPIAPQGVGQGNTRLQGYHYGSEDVQPANPGLYSHMYDGVTPKSAATRVTKDSLLVGNTESSHPFTQELKTMLSDTQNLRSSATSYPLLAGDSHRGILQQLEIQQQQQQQQQQADSTVSPVSDQKSSGTQAVTQVQPLSRSLVRQAKQTVEVAELTSLHGNTAEDAVTVKESLRSTDAGSALHAAAMTKKEGGSNTNRILNGLGREETQHEARASSPASETSTHNEASTEHNQRRLEKTQASIMEQFLKAEKKERDWSEYASNLVKPVD